MHKFGAERKHTKGGNILRFDPAKLVKVGETYNLKTDIQTKVTAGQQVDGESSESGEGSIETGGSYTQNAHAKNTDNELNNYRKSSPNEQDLMNCATKNNVNGRTFIIAITSNHAV